MTWRLLPIALVFALAWACLGADSAGRLIEVDDRPVALATLPCARNLQATSSGFLIDDQLVMTVAHALFDSRHFAVRDVRGDWHEGRIVHLDLERDLALVWVDGLRSSAVEVAVADIDQPVTLVAGAASGQLEGQVVRRVRLTTEVIGDRSRSSARSGYELSVEIAGGDSGAAVIDERDRLVGMVFAKSTTRSASWATSATELVDAVDRRGGPTWECDRPSDVQLVLAEPE